VKETIDINAEKKVFMDIVKRRLKRMCQDNDVKKIVTCGIDLNKPEGLLKVLTAIEVDE
jgi:hypothetical protein